MYVHSTLTVSVRLTPPLIVRKRRFDLGCKTPEVVRLGDVARLGGQMTRMNSGVSCGEKRATYTVTCVSNWGDISCTPELNSLGSTVQ